MYSVDPDLLPCSATSDLAQCYLLCQNTLGKYGIIFFEVINQNPDYPNNQQISNKAQIFEPNCEKMYLLTCAPNEDSN